MLKKWLSIAASVMVVIVISLTVIASEVVYEKPSDAQLFSDFNTPFTVIGWDDDAQVDAGDGVNKVQILAKGGSTGHSTVDGATVDGAIKIEYKSSDADPFVRFRHTQSFASTADGEIVSKYNYMVIRIRGTADEGVSVSGGPGQGALCIGFGGMANWSNGFTFRNSDYSGQGTAGKAPDGSTLAPITNKYQTLIIKMEDSYFSSMGDVSEGNQMSVRSIGNFNKTVYIDEIYFTNNIPQVDTGSDDDEPEYTDNNVIPADAIFIEDGRRDEFLLPFGDKKITFANGDKTSFLNEVTINDVTDPGAFTLSNGIITFNCAPEAYLNYSFGENYYVNYEYIVFRIRSTDGSDGSKFAVRLGSYGAQEVMFDNLRFDAGHYVKPITGEWQDIYVSTEDFNGLNGMEYLKFHGKANGTFEIDCIYMTNTVPEGYEPGPEAPALEEPTTDVTEPTSNVTEPTKDGNGTGTTTTTDTNSGSPKTGTTFPMGIIVLAVFATAAIILSVNRKTCKS